MNIKKKNRDVSKIIDTKLKILDIAYNGLIIISLLIVFILNEKVFEGAILVFTFLFLRYCYPCTYHCNTILHCYFWTVAIFLIGIRLVLPVNITLFGSILVGCGITFVLWYIQDKREIYELNSVYGKKIDTLIEKIKTYEEIDIYKMTEQELRQYGASKKLSEIEQDILCLRVFEHLKISEICEYKKYGRTTIKYHLAQIKLKLGIDYV